MIGPKGSFSSASSGQPLDAGLTDISDLAVTDGNIIVGDGSNWVAESGATARTSLGLTIGTNVQAYDAELAAVAGLTSAADKLPYFTGSGTASVAAFTAAGRALVDDANVAAQRTTLGLVVGTNVQAYDAQLADIAALAVTNSNIIVGDGTNWVAESGSTARTSLGLAIGTNVQAYDAQLADIAALAVTDSNVIVGDGSNWVAESGSTARASLGLAIGTNVQAYDAQLADIAALAVTDSNVIVGDGSNWVAESGSTARASLGLAIGTNVQAYDAGIADIAGLAVTNGNVIVGDGSNWVAESGATARTSLGAAALGANTFTGKQSLADAGSVDISTPLLAGADHTYTGLSAQMLAGGAIAAFDLVCIHTTTQEVVEADASAYATARVIGIAPAAISDTATGTVLLQGFIRDDTWAWTAGSTLYLSETAGAMTHTAPSTDGAFVLVVGVALSPDVVYINPSMDVIEHA
tara:strand:- start:59 stop:1456 length:1398 start_codon:yes stop_codon:yes gene_type:complete